MARKLYDTVIVWGHPRASKYGHVYKHILIAEKVYGRYIKFPELVHHKDGNRLNNNLDNLIVCKNQIHHALLHIRANALKECGHANWGKCKYCKQYDDPKNLKVTPFHTFHKSCNKEYNKFYMRKRRKRLTDF